MAAEVAKHFFPKLVDLHNYIPANSTAQKLSNWNLLNRQDSSPSSPTGVAKCSWKVFSKMNFHVPEETVKRIVLSAAGVIEPVLSTLREKIDKKLEHTTDNILDLEYFDTRNHEQPHAEIHQTEVAQLRGGDMKKDDKRRQRNWSINITASSEQRIVSAASSVSFSERVCDEASWYNIVDSEFKGVRFEKLFY
ncbi:hypothetical protein F2P81_020169 [Scophthalmus maximus]|uniref:CH-like domain-containing protein n=1 Tax=Scophthalmus maximus TaxID=52904 RepID=A0A6A4S5E4_SCOMX|nr:hypothetical protein F2P81_020169 [Scophthalmus maximus]